MPNLTGAEYKAQMDAARTHYAIGQLNYLDKCSVWGDIAGVYSLLATNQLDFDDRGVVPASASLAYRTDAENLLTQAKARLTTLPLNSAAAAVATSHASAMAFWYVESVKRQEKLAGGV